MTIGIDGDRDQGYIVSTGCCPPDLCNVSVCDLMCNMIQLLPQGPMWDRAKFSGFTAARSCADTDDIAVPDCVDPELFNSCTSMVRHAMYAGRKLHEMLRNTLLPALRESRPETSVVMLDDWLTRLGWQDCFASACTSQAHDLVSPFSYESECGLTNCDPTGTYPDDLYLAVKRGIATSLWRLSKGIIPNRAAINFVIAPLGAEIKQDAASCYGLGQVNLGMPGCTNECSQCELHVEVGPTSETLPRVSTQYCTTNDIAVQELAEPLASFTSPGMACPPLPYAPKIAVLPEKIYPGVLAAECIVRSILSGVPCKKVTYHRTSCE